MKLKTLFLSTALVAGSLSATAFAADGTIHFTGALVDAPCVINSADLEQTINLGQVKINQFTAAGETADVVPFTFRLENCNLTDPADPSTNKWSKVAVTFTGLNDVDNSQLLGLVPGADTATGIAVQLVERDRTTPIQLGIASQDIDLLDQEEQELVYFARYMSTKAPADMVAGSANANTDFTLSYK